jgi:alpha-glucosidase
MTDEEKEEPQKNMEQDPLTQDDVSLHNDIPDISVAPISKQYLKEVRQLIPSGNRFYFSDGVSDVEIKVVSDEIIRVRMAPQGEFLDEFSYALDDRKFLVSRIETTETTEYYSISTNVVSCRVRKSDFFISFVDLHEVVMNEDAHCECIGKRMRSMVATMFTVRRSVNPVSIF